MGKAASTTLPERIGRYVVLRKLGEGGMGVVVQAYDGELDRTLAIKLLRPRRATVQARLRLQREAQAMARLSHPNVVTVFDVGTIDDDRVFVAMEVVEGTTLREWMETPRPWSEVVGLLLEAGRGLAAAHEAGLVHRDFKPDNVLVDRQGRPKVTDFGLVRASEESVDDGGFETSPEEPRIDVTKTDGDLVMGSAGVESGMESSLASMTAPLTRFGALVGTPHYMAPEQLAGRRADARSDQFSFCIVLHEALWGVRPHASDDFKTPASQRAR